MTQNIEKSQEFYQEFFSEEWDLDYANRQRYEIVFSLIDDLPINETGRVLDIGAGSGRISEFLNRRFMNVVSMDIVVSPLFSETVDNTDISPVEGALPKLPFADDSFDLVMCSEVIEHIPSRSNQYEAIEEIARVTGTGGYVVLSTPNPESVRKQTMNIVKQVGKRLGLADTDDTGGQLVENWISSNELRTALERHMVIKQQRGSYYNILSHIPILRDCSIRYRTLLLMLI